MLRNYVDSIAFANDKTPTDATTFLKHISYN